MLLVELFPFVAQMLDFDGEARRVSASVAAASARSRAGCARGAVRIQRSSSVGCWLTRLNRCSVGFGKPASTLQTRISSTAARAACVRPPPVQPHAKTVDALPRHQFLRRRTCARRRCSTVINAASKRCVSAGILGAPLQRLPAFRQLRIVDRGAGNELSAMTTPRRRQW